MHEEMPGGETAAPGAVPRTMLGTAIRIGYHEAGPNMLHSY